MLLGEVPRRLNALRNREGRKTRHLIAEDDATRRRLGCFLLLSGAWRQTAHWHVQGCVGKAVSPRRRVVTHKFLRRKMRHASLTGRTPVWQNGVAEQPGHSHAHLAEASSSPRRAVDGERGVDERTPRDSDSCSTGHCEDPGQQVAGALPLRLPPGHNKSHPGGP